MFYNYLQRLSVMQPENYKNSSNLLGVLGERLQVKDNVKMPERRNCIRCGFVSSQEICKACVLLEGLNRGLPKLGIGKSNKIKKIINLHIDKKTNNKL